MQNLSQWLKPVLSWLITTEKVSPSFNNLVEKSDNPNRTVLLALVDTIGPKERKILFDILKPFQKLYE